jgi:hypothetical protein
MRLFITLLPSSGISVMAVLAARATLISYPPPAGLSIPMKSSGARQLTGQSARHEIAMVTGSRGDGVAQWQVTFVGGKPRIDFAYSKKTML